MLCEECLLEGGGELGRDTQKSIDKIDRFDADTVDQNATRARIV